MTVTPQLVLPITGPPGPLTAATTGSPSHYLVQAVGGVRGTARAILISAFESHTDAGQTIHVYGGGPPRA